MTAPASEASLESLIELEDFGLEILHPGGADTTAKLASSCEIREGSRVLDVASGTGATARFLAERYGAEITGLDYSDAMIARARRKAAAARRTITFVRGDAHALPFRSGSFDVSICECTLSLLDKERAIEEMVRVVRSGGRIGFHEICWTERAPRKLQARLVELEGERPETLQGWTALMDRLDVSNVQATDLSELMPQWLKQTRKELGIRGLLGTTLRVLSEWGVAGLWRILRAERIFGSRYLGYGMIVATRR